MWENPFYFFRIPYIDQVGKRRFKQLIINVTFSAMYKDIKKDLRNILNILIGKGSDYGVNTVLDFGCGKLRTVDYIIGKGKKNTVVDFKEIIEKYGYLEEKLEKLKSNKLFNKLDFPKPFMNDKSKFDLVLLINVFPIMPIFLERLFVLQILHNKVKEGKYLLWYAMINPPVYRKRERFDKYSLGDGIWIGEKEQKTFYKYHSLGHITLLMYLSGFILERKFKVPAVDALLFKRTKFNLFNGIITQNLIENLIKSQMILENSILKSTIEDNIEISPYPEDYSIFNLIKIYLRKIIPGRIDLGYPDKFKRITAGIFQFLFTNQLTNMVIEDPIDEGKGFIDITFQTTGKKGFFVELQDKYKVMCPIIFIECKNKNKKLTNTEYSQLYDRFDDYRGKFGILVSRDKVDENEVLSHVKPKIKKGYYVLVLDDKDLLKLLKLRIEDGEEAVDEFFEKKVKELVM